MKNIAKRLVVVAVGAVVVGMVAFGQTTMTAQIPFAFQTAQGTLPAGRYTVTELARGAQVVRLRNQVSYKAAMEIGTLAVYTEKQDLNTGKLIFRCDDGCRLVSIQSPHHTINLSSRGHSGGREVAVIATVTSMRGE